MTNIYTPVDCHSMAISNPAFWFLLVSEPQKPIKPRKPGNLETQVLFPRNLTCLHTVPFHSIQVRQSRVTGPQKSTKCHDGHGHFGQVTKSFLDSKKIF